MHDAPGVSAALHRQALIARLCEANRKAQAGDAEAQREVDALIAELTSASSQSAEVSPKPSSPHADCSACDFEASAAKVEREERRTFPKPRAFAFVVGVAEACVSNLRRSPLMLCREHAQDLRGALKAMGIGAIEVPGGAPLGMSKGGAA